jgi:hypothetical protein
MAEISLFDVLGDEAGAAVDDLPIARVGRAASALARRRRFQQNAAALATNSSREMQTTSRAVIHATGCRCWYSPASMRQAVT